MSELYPQHNYTQSSEIPYSVPHVNSPNWPSLSAGYRQWELMLPARRRSSVARTFPCRRSVRMPDGRHLGSQKTRHLRQGPPRTEKGRLALRYAVSTRSEERTRRKVRLG